MKIKFIPDDFIDNEYGSNDDCAVARACLRHFGIQKNHIVVGPINIHIFNPIRRLFKIKGGFGRADFDTEKELFKNNKSHDNYFVIKEVDYGKEQSN